MCVYAVNAAAPAGWAASANGVQVTPPFLDSYMDFCRPTAKPCFESRNHTRTMRPPDTWLIFLSGLICGAIRFQFAPDVSVNQNESSVTIQPSVSFRKKIDRGCSTSSLLLQRAPPSLDTSAV